MTHQEVIQRIIAYHPPIDEKNTCDGFKAGNPSDVCTGIVTAIVPTVEVIQKTKELGANLLIVHEPTFYMTPDYPDWHTDFTNSVVEEKKAMLQEAGITIWRDHDHMHANQPDSIFTGVIRRLGWEDYRMDVELPLFFGFEIPKMTVEEMNSFLQEKFHLNGLRYIGNPSDEISRIAIIGHLCPGMFMEESEDAKGNYHDYATSIIRELEEDRFDAVIPGEVIEWNLLSYIRDAAAMGRNKACFNIGHFSLEEPGMEYAAEWIRELVPQELPVHYVRVEEMYHFH
ncbi:MAG: Nif3-like dinuclear metal center hexameric protein [Lachnospiraceae bacterium]|nr:Nif3-like dinuclear metal center hexameric protein [Lachnospiraceae bacterium]